MKNIDDDIKKSLVQEANRLDEILQQEPGLFERIGNSFKGNMKKWMILTFVLTLVVTAVFLYCAYLFIIATNVDDRIFWGVWFIVSFIIQVALKQWSYMEINRCATIREVKRIEVAVERLELLLRENVK